MARLTPVTQRDVARACGVHQTTVCLALGNSPSIPAATRLKVRAVADQLGYRPNAAASRLSLLRSKDAGGRGTRLAWLNQEASPSHWRTEPDARGHFESAGLRAAERGYQLEEIWTREPGMTTGRLIQVVRARGIEGVIVPVHRHFDPALITPAWADFALIGLNDHRLAGWFGAVCPDHFGNAGAACDHVRQLGLSRPGLLLSPEADAACGGLLHGGFLRAQAGWADADRVPVCLLPEDAERRCAVFRDWLAEYEPDAVLATEAGLVAAARREGFNATWIGLVSAAAPFDGGFAVAGGSLGAFAVDCLVNKMRCFETGLGRTSCLHVLPSSWTAPVAARRRPASHVA